MAYQSFRAIVPAGGAGRRLWPVSRQAYPKFLHDFTGAGSSLLQITVDRLSTLADEVVVVTGEEHAQVVQEHVPACAVLTEPVAKDSMPAIALAAAVLTLRYPREDLVVGSFAADHLISEQQIFNQVVNEAVELARKDEVVTIGITPTHPATAYGYIRPSGEHHNFRGVVAHRIDRFEEKPDAATAQKFVEAGYVWNGGMYVARAQVLLDYLQQLRPDLAEGVWQVAHAWDSSRRREVAHEIWPTLEQISIDHALAEPLAPQGKMMVLPADLGWSDIGDWNAIGDLLEASGHSDAMVSGGAGALTTVDSAGVVARGQKHVVVVGVDGAVVIETDDAILVTTRERAQEVKKATDLLQETGFDHLL